MLLLDILAKMTEQLAAALADEEQLSPSLLILGPPGVGEFSWHRLSRIKLEAHLFVTCGHIACVQCALEAIMASNLQVLPCRSCTA